MTQAFRARAAPQRDDEPIRPDSGARVPGRRASLAIAALASLMAVTVLVQFVLAGMALFMNSLYWWPHHVVGHSLTPVALLLLLLAFAGRQPADVRWRATALLVLLLIQGALPRARGLPGAVHPLNALFLMGLIESLVRRARHAARRSGLPPAR